MPIPAACTYDHGIPVLLGLPSASGTTEDGISCHQGEHLSMLDPKFRFLSLWRDTCSGQIACQLCSLVGVSGMPGTVVSPDASRQSLKTCTWTSREKQVRARTICVRRSSVASLTAAVACHRADTEVRSQSYFVLAFGRDVQR